MHILVINPLWPRPSHSSLSANVVFFELIMALSRQNGVKVTFLKINKTGDLEPSADEEEGIKSMVANGVHVSEPLQLPSMPHRRSKILRTLFPKLEDFYPEVIYKELAKKAVLAIGADVLFVPWAEWTTALCCEIPIVKFAYYGNPDAKSALAMTKFNFKYGKDSLITYLAKRSLYKKLEKMHLEVMAKYEILGDVAENDAAYYKNNSHKNAFYIQNVWIDRLNGKWKDKIPSKANNPLKIVANIGRLGATANTHGLEILGNEFLPELKRVMNGRSYEVHLFGSGKPHPAVVEKLKVPEVKIRGFIDDIDGELLSSDVFLCLNNGSAYNVGHTRYLHAWSLGCCVIAHKNATLAMPEILHGENALLGETTAEIADLIKMAIDDPNLTHKIGTGGYQTFKKYFTADKVVPKILDRIKTYFSSHVR